MSIDNLGIRQQKSLKNLHRRLNSTVSKALVPKNKDCKIRFCVKSEVHEVWGYKPISHGRIQKAIIGYDHLPDPLGQITRSDSRK